MDKIDKPQQKLDAVIAEANKARSQREQSYREKALKMYPWVCGKCEREFTRVNLQELTVHHRDHDHDNNPEDGSNWELLCLYCHDNEHSRLLDNGVVDSKSITRKEESSSATHKPFESLGNLLKGK